jgi:hypothetical protein
MRAAKSVFWIRGLPPRRTVRASDFTCSSACIENPTPAMFVRSWPSRYFAIVQPSFSAPTRLVTGTRTSVKNTSFTS